MYTKLLDKQTKLALIGLGYVGLPIAMEFAKHVSVIGFEELTRRGQLIIAQTYASFEIWMTVAALYLIMTLAIAKFVSFMEHK